MPLNLSIVFNEPQRLQLDRPQESVQVIGDLLPLVLARYGIETQPAARRIETEAKVGDILQQT